MHFANTSSDINCNSLLNTAYLSDHSFFYILNLTCICHKCHKQYEFTAILNLHLKKCRSRPYIKKIAIPSPINPSCCTYKYYAYIYPFCNALFSYLCTYSQAKSSIIRKLEASLGKKLMLKSKALENINYVSNTNLVFNKKVPVIKASNANKHVYTIRFSYIYLHI
jgi:hypothetical protein